LLDSRAKYGDPVMIQARSAASDEAKKFHVTAIDRFAAAAPGNAPLFVQLKLYAWCGEAGGGNSDSSTIGGGDLGGDLGGGSGKESEWDNSSEMASSVHTTGTSRSKSMLGSVFGRKRHMEGQMRGKPILHGHLVVIESEGR
jgi:hypothetical protein